ncbi:uncharacterized protein [Battus philenor]|uniref:uncharacterized protein n=1 Tax=Battus philenor TaxID=42288 RepID=UPI0035CF0A37
MFETSQQFMLFACLIFPRPTNTNPDNQALWGGTLKTMQRAACDDKMVALACPRGTSINIQVAQYGIASDCADDGLNTKPLTVEVVGEEKCLWPNTLQYSLLQTVVEACQKKPQCKFSTKFKPGFEDPCPLARKFVEVAYKCRPYKFRSRTGCQNDAISVSCNPHSRIAIFDALYGRTAFELNKCQQTKGMPDETCTAPFAMETVMQICHGKRRCQLIVNHETFGTPCKSGIRTYLKIVYACVPLGVLTEKYESALENDETFRSDHQDENFFDETDEGTGGHNAVPTVINSGVAPSMPGIIHNHQQRIDVSTTNDHKKDENRNLSATLTSSFKMFIYIAIIILILIILILAIIGVRHVISRRTKNKSNSNDMFTTETPNIFGDGLSDIDNDVDISHISGTFHDPVHPDMILYKDIPGSSTLRAMRPLSTVYPCVGSSMYGNADFVSTQSRDFVANRFATGKAIDNDVVVSPKSLRGYTGSQYFYG